jgi:hypothetical protein
MEGGHGHEGKMVVSKRMAQIQSGMSTDSGALTISAALRIVHEERLAERDINMIRDKGDDPTFFNLSRLTVEGLARSTMNSVLELWGTECKGGTPLTAETEVGEGTKANKSKSTGDQTEFSMELGGDTFAMLGHACEKFGTFVLHISSVTSFSTGRRCQRRPCTGPSSCVCVCESKTAVVDGLR